MSCCGRERGRPGPTVTGPRARPKPAAPTAPRQTISAVELEYLGSGSLAVFGPVTGRLYRFDARGRRRIAVDVRDRGALAVLPGLAEVRREGG